MLKKSPLFDYLTRTDDISFEHFQSSATEDVDFINWNDYLLPADYGDAEYEYRSIRGSCAIFDVSPMRKIRVTGSQAGNFFDHLVTRPVSDLPPMQATYTVFCNDDGSMKDDAILYKFADNDYLYMPSDIDHRPYFQSVCDRFELPDVNFEESTANYAGLAVQGPASARVMNSLGFASAETMKPFAVQFREIEGHRYCIARMGFTADLGYEIWMSPDAVKTLMQRFDAARDNLQLPIPGYGLEALQVCRIEGGFIVAGWDCSSEADPEPGFERSPLELNLGWLVRFDGPEYAGREALREQKANGTAHVLRNMSTTESVEIPDGTEIVAETGGQTTVIGRVNNSVWSWGLNRKIGNASLLAEYAELTRGRIAIGDATVELVLGKGPFVTIEHRNQVPAAMDA